MKAIRLRRHNRVFHKRANQVLVIVSLGLLSPRYCKCAETVHGFNFLANSRHPEHSRSLIQCTSWTVWRYCLWYLPMSNIRGVDPSTEKTVYSAGRNSLPVERGKKQMCDHLLSATSRHCVAVAGATHSVIR